MKLKGKTALITGATGVIGNTIARAFAREGCNLILSGPSKRKTSALVRQFSTFENVEVRAIPADVSNKKSVQQLFKKTGRNSKGIDILVTAAGIYGAIGTTDQIEPEAWMEAIRVNLLGTFMTIKYSLPFLRKSRRGKIIALAGGGEGALTNRSSYVSSKGGVLRLVETLARELVPIDINAISPGSVVSGFVDDLLKAGPKKLGKERYAEALKQKRGTIASTPPEKAAALAVFLASSESDGISGKNISAVWDKWQEFGRHKKELAKSDVYTMRRIKPKDRGYDW